jgi:hypothetical protein
VSVVHHKRRAIRQPVPRRAIMFRSTSWTGVAHLRAVPDSDGLRRCFGEGVGQRKVGRFIASELRSSMKTGHSKAMLRCAITAYARDGFFGGIFHDINSRLRNVTVVGDPGRLCKAVSRRCGNLANFVWPAWAGLRATPKSGDVFLRRAQLQREALGAAAEAPGRS